MGAFSLALFLALPVLAAEAESAAPTKTDAVAAPAAGDAAKATPPAAAEATKPAEPTAKPAEATAKPAEPAAKPSEPAAKPTEVAAAPKPRKLPPPKGSQVKPDDNFCVLCHTNKDQWDEKDPKSFRLYLAEDKVRNDVHWQHGVNCSDCHGGNYDTDKLNVAHASEDGFTADPALLLQRCGDCHNKVAGDFVKSAHAKVGPKELPGGGKLLSCALCHGPTAHELLPVHDQRSPVFAANLSKMCGDCHQHAALNVVKSVHDKAGPKNERGSGTLLSCAKCHGENAHGLLPVRDAQSPVFLDNQIKTCGGCHENHLASYDTSVHAQALYKLGLQVTAVCADCHGAHGIYRPPDERSTLFPSNVAATCGKCHRFIEERLEHSVHARAHGPGGEAERVAPGGKAKRTPSCTSCHQSHSIANPESTAFRLELPNRCGNCHFEMSKEYATSVHGELTALGYGPAAKCSDCHGAHDILAVDNPASTLSPENRRATCGKCHPHATTNFLAFDPHADHTSPARGPLLYWVYTGLMTLLITTFCVFGAHSLFWLVRGLVHVHYHGRPRGLVPGRMAYVRFTHFHRLAHTFLLLSFLGLALTGLPLKYSQSGWAKALAYALGGFESTSTWHRVFALVTFGCLIVFLVRMVRSLWLAYKRRIALRKVIFGPDSPVPNLRDVKDAGRMALWFVGLGPKPTFERWTYWEKFDFWGAITDIVIIGSTGLVLWFPNVFCSVLPGETLNIAKVIHSTQALLATGFVFAIHFFSTHFRAEKFPADMSILTGLVSDEEMEEERPEYLERLQREGRAEKLRARVPGRRHLWPYMLGGFTALAAGLALLAGMIAAGLGH